MLPAKELIIAACRGLPHDNHPMLDAAGELARLHEIRERAPRFDVSKLDRRRTQLVRAVDRWITLVTPIPYESVGAEDETVGRVVDRLAELVAQTHSPIPDPPDVSSAEAWMRVSEVADSYQGLVDGLRAGTC
ncbi:hypothetical protein IT779_03465 [Nocardia sp. NEAU-351]|uniref:DUF4254 domain-containing protein n=2 Tax=Nocardia bovistercoris TaxID=2785916 RepID=A0A931N2B7_9NOCA|nr:hypothetical protein [Nocardia bovistercoris]